MGGRTHDGRTAGPASLAAVSALVLWLVFGASPASAAPLDGVRQEVESVVAPVAETTRAALPQESAPVEAPPPAEAVHEVADGTGPSLAEPGSVDPTAPSAGDPAAPPAAGTEASGRAAGGSTGEDSTAGSPEVMPAPARGSSDGAELRRAVSVDAVPVDWFFVFVWRAIALGEERAISPPGARPAESAGVLPKAPAARSLAGLREPGRQQGGRPPGGAPSSSTSDGSLPTPSDVVPTVDDYGALIWLALVILGAWAVVKAESRIGSPH